MKALIPSFVAALGATALLACGGDNSAAATATATTPQTTSTSTQARAAANTQATASASTPSGTTITLRQTRFGKILMNSRRQAIYIFQLDRRNKTNCYGECAELWPPVYTKGKPRATNGVRASLLGTIKRRDGRMQVTYAGKPLYYYVHEGPGQVLCHNVNLNGGLWWVVGANGKRRP